MSVRQRRPRDAGSIVVRSRKDGTQSFMLKWRNYTETMAVTSKREALALLPAFVARAQSGDIDRQRAARNAREAQPTLSDWAKTFLSQHVTLDPDRLATRAAYEAALRLYVLPSLGSLKLHEVTGPLIRQTMQDLYKGGEGKAIKTLQLTHAVIRRAFEAAIEDGLLIVNPVPKFAKLRLGEPENPSENAKRAALTVAQFASLLHRCDDVDLKLYVATMAGCGLRPGEALGLRWRDIDLKEGLVHVRGSAKRAYATPGSPRRVWIGRTKTMSSVRDVAMGPTLTALFAAEKQRQEALQRELHGENGPVRRLKSFLPTEACVFPKDATTPAGLVAPCDPDGIRVRFLRAAKAAGLRTTPHALRHTHISHAIEGGLSLADTAARAGHSSVAMTARTYVHVVSDSQRKAALIGDGLLTSPVVNGERGKNEAAGDK